MMNITTLIDEVIKERGMSRRQLAIKAGVKPSTLQSAMERGDMMVSTLEKIAKALNISVHGVLEGTSERMTNYKRLKTFTMEEMAGYLTYVIIGNADQIQDMDAVSNHPQRQQVYNDVLEMLKSEE